MDSPLFNRQFLRQYNPRDYYHSQDSLARQKHSAPSGDNYRNNYGNDWSLAAGTHYTNSSRFSQDHMQDRYSNGSVKQQHSREQSNCTSNPESKKRTEKTIWDVLGVFAGVTSLQGVPYIQKANRWWSTVFWIVVFLAGCGAMIFHAYYLINLFFQFDYTTVVTLGYDHLQFPSVTICNMNPFVLNKVDETSEEMKEFLDNIKPPSEDDPPPNNQNQNNNAPTSGSRNPRPDNPDNRYVLSETESEGHSNLQEFLEAYGNLSIETRYNISQRPDVFIQQCSFNGFKCTFRDFTRHLSPLYGKCWTFNGVGHVNHTTPLISYLPGKDYGLNLRLYIEGDQYLPGVSEDVGAVVSIHDYDTMTFPEQNGISVPAGMTTLIGVKLINVTRLGGRYSSCKHGEQFYADFNAKYTREACLSTCAHKRIKQQCDCYMAPYEYYYPTAAVKNSRKCGEDEEQCVTSILQAIANGAPQCSDCVPACSEKSYDKLISASRWPQPSFHYSIVEDACETDGRYCQKLRDNPQDEIPKNFVNLKIYYRELNFENIVEQKSYELVQFVSDVGGVLGLWVGISVLSIVELIQLIFELVNFGCKKHCCARSPSQKPN